MFDTNYRLALWPERTGVRIRNLRWHVRQYLSRNSLDVLAPKLKIAPHMDTKQYSYGVGGFQLAYTVMQPVAGVLVGRVAHQMVSGLINTLSADVFELGKVGTAIGFIGQAS